MTHTQIVERAYALFKPLDFTSDGDIVVQTLLPPSPRNQEWLIRQMGTEGRDFRCIRNRSGRSVTFHPLN